MKANSLNDIVTLTTSYASNKSLLYLRIFTNVFRDDVPAHAEPDGDEQAIWIVSDKFFNHCTELFCATWQTLDK